MESVEIVISGDHEMYVIGICNTLIALMICRPWFLQSVVLQLRGRAIVLVGRG